MGYIIILYGLLVLLAVLTGYFLGNKRRLEDEAQTIKRYIESITKNKEIKIIHKKEPISQKAENIKELDKNNASQ